MILSFGYDNRTAPVGAGKVFDVRDLSHDLSSEPALARYREITEYAQAHPSEIVAIGCKKGRHRSSVLASKVAAATRQSVWHLDS